MLGAMAPDVAYALDGSRLPVWPFSHQWHWLIGWSLPLVLAGTWIVRRAAPVIATHLPPAGPLALRVAVALPGAADRGVSHPAGAVGPSGAGVERVDDDLVRVVVETVDRQGSCPDCAGELLDVLGDVAAWSLVAPGSGADAGSCAMNVTTRAWSSPTPTYRRPAQVTASSAALGRSAGWRARLHRTTSSMAGGRPDKSGSADCTRRNHSWPPGLPNGCTPPAR
jgi:hypothetical protein